MKGQLNLSNGLLIEVDTDGNVYTLDHQTVRANGRKDNRKGKKLKPAIDRYGYLRYTFSNKGKRVSVYGHQLVAMTFLPNPDNKPTVNHINGVKIDNRLENLEWATQKEQKAHSITHHLCDKNISALQEANNERKRKVSIFGKTYESLNQARKETLLAIDTIKKYGEVI